LEYAGELGHHPWPGRPRPPATRVPAPVQGLPVCWWISSLLVVALTVALLAYRPRAMLPEGNAAISQGLEVPAPSRGCGHVIPDFRRGTQGPIAACVKKRVLIALRGRHLRGRPRRLAWPRTPDFQSARVGLADHRPYRAVSIR